MHEQSENNAGQIASSEITKNIAEGTSICAAVMGAVWRKTTYINHETGQIGIAHQILRGRPGTKWNNFYTIALNIPQQEKY